MDEKLARHLNHLLIICNDGKYGYMMAAKSARSEKVKAILYQYSMDRNEFVNVLKHEIRKAGCDPEKGGGPLGALHRAWIDVKTALTTNDDKTILQACITGELAAANAYKEVLERALLPADTRNVVVLQQSGIRNAIKKIEELLHDQQK